MFPATLFDFNGVLVDDELVHLAAFQDTLAPYGITLTDADYWDKYLGFDDVGAFEAIFADNGRELLPGEVKGLVEAKRPHYMRRAATDLKSFPGAAELVRRQRAAGPVAIVSGALEDEIELGLTHLGVRELVGRIISAERTRASKPDPEGYELGIAWLHSQGVIGTHALVFEDSPAGIEAAVACGLTVVAVAHSYEVSLLRSTGAALVLPTIADATDEVLAELYRSRFPK